MSFESHPLLAAMRRSIFPRLSRSLAVAAALAGAAALTSSSRANIVYDESVNGDFSNNGLLPTTVTLGAGWNTIMGTTGRGSSGVDRDYFTVTVPTNWSLSSITEVAGTNVGGAVSFIGLEWGNQLTLPTNTATANGLLGWTHYGPTSMDIDLEPAMSMPANGSSGFTDPLGAGTYTFWIQDFNQGSFNYAFALAVTPVPEPSTYAAFGALMLVGLALRRRFKSKPQS